MEEFKEKEHKKKQLHLNRHKHKEALPDYDPEQINNNDTPFVESEPLPVNLNHNEHILNRHIDINENGISKFQVGFKPNQNYNFGNEMYYPRINNINETPIPFF